MKKCLIVVDYQNDFVDGALGFDKAPTIEEKIIKKIKQYQENNQDVIYTQDTHDDDYLTTEEGRNLPIKHCIKGTNGHAFTPNIQALQKSGDRIFQKSSFPSLELGNYLKEKQYGAVELVGLVSNICVISNAIIAKSALPKATISVDVSATASFDETLHEKALDVMEGLHILLKNRG